MAQGFWECLGSISEAASHLCFEAAPSRSANVKEIQSGEN